KVNPSIPFWGGPNGIDTNGTVQGENVYSYGNSELRGGVSQLSPKQGVSLGDAGGGWSHNVYTASPGIPGDSGSAFLNSPGAALDGTPPAREHKEASRDGGAERPLERECVRGALGAVPLHGGVELFVGRDLVGLVIHHDESLERLDQQVDEALDRDAVDDGGDG